MTDGTGRVTLWGIEVFLAVAEEGAVQAAARRLGASTSSVSQQLSNLESALGATLLDRGRRPAQLTAAGRMFQKRAHRILQEAMQARAEITAGDLHGLTDLRLGMIEDFDADVTPALLSAMAGELHECQFLLETGASHRLFSLMEDGALDVIVSAKLVGSAPEGMEVHPLMEEPFIIAVPRNTLDDVSNPLDTLRTTPLVQYTQRHLMGRQIAEHLQQQDVTLAHRFELDSYHSIMAMVAAGAGWTILTPLGYQRAHRFREQVDILPLPFAPLSRQISLTARNGALGDMPSTLVSTLKPLLQDMVVTPLVEKLPWLDGELRTL